MESRTTNATAHPKSTPHSIISFRNPEVVSNAQSSAPARAVDAFPVLPISFGT